MAEDSAAALRRAADCVRDAEALLICSGAGLGVDSGLGTFRGRNAGVWPPLRAMRMDFSSMSNPDWFRDDPRLAWAFWHFRHQAYTKGEPHAGYALLAKWGRRMRHGLFSATSNIDGHWIRTEGVGEALTYECHGAVTHIQYVADDGTRPWRTNDAQIGALQVPQCDLVPGEAVEVRLQDGRWVPAVVDEQGGVASQAGPLTADAVRRPGGDDLFRVREGCPLPADGAGKALRPNVLMFGDWGVNSARIDEQQERFERWEASLPADVKIVIVEVGAGEAVRTIRGIAEGAARRFRNSALVRINLEDSAIGASAAGPVRVSVGGLGALAALSQIDALLPGDPPLPGSGPTAAAAVAERVYEGDPTVLAEGRGAA